MIPNMMAKKMQQGQLSTEQLLRVIRVDSMQQDSVTYQFARGFSIIATARGISFGGSSTIFNPGQMHQVKKYIRFAEKLSNAMMMGGGIIPEGELHRELTLREKFENGLYTVWYQGHRPEYEFSHSDRMAAIRAVRAKWISFYGTKTV